MDRKQKIENQKKKLIKDGKLHFFHYVIVFFSILLTFGAWLFSKHQVSQKVEERFNREADQSIALVKERMELYENALWGGVALYDSSGDISYQEWYDYAHSLRIEDRYPGINGIGVIYNIQHEDLEEYLKKYKIDRPDFKVHPTHENIELWPITYIEPVAPNRKAVGLDMAFETNRYIGITNSKETGMAQITGPIILVQDEKRTPGFLFYAPFYKDGIKPLTVEDRHEYIIGVTYAPFIMHELMEGTLSSESRHVGMAIYDGGELLYQDRDFGDEFERHSFEKHVTIEMYGRNWEFHIWSNSGFKKASEVNQSHFILIGGIIIDSLLIMIFVSISRSNRMALSYAEEVTQDFKEGNEKLAVMNENLEQFVYIVSHDLQSPAGKIMAFVELFKDVIQKDINDEAKDYIDSISEHAARIYGLVDALLDYSTIGKNNHISKVSISHMISDVVCDLNLKGGKVEYENLPSIFVDEMIIFSLFRNLLSNSIKYNKNIPHIKISCQEREGDWLFTIEDNGIGIEDKNKSKIFEAFSRVYYKEYSGSGLGLSICKKAVNAHGGDIWVEKSEVGKGTVFCFTIRKLI
jgi:signal transduction histidine kinase